MNFEANDDRQKYEDAVVRLQTAEAQNKRLVQECRDIKEMLCARKRSDGSVTIDFAALVQKLGIEASLELRKTIDETYNVSGAAGEKPRVRLHAGG